MIPELTKVELTKIEYAKNHDDMRYMFLEVTFSDEIDVFPICSVWIGWDSERKEFLFFGGTEDEDTVELVDGNDLKFNMTYNITDEELEDSIMTKLILEKVKNGEMNIPKMIIEYML